MNQFEIFCEENGIEVEFGYNYYSGEKCKHYKGFCGALATLVTIEIDKGTENYLKEALKKFYQKFPYLKK